LGKARRPPHLPSTSLFGLQRESIDPHSHQGRSRRNAHRQISPADLRRLELEYDIPVLEAEALLKLRQGSIIEKVRHVIPCGDLAWEVDVFSGDNFGLVIAEVELRHEHQHVELPTWIGAEITGQPQYYNSSLVQRPFCSWSRQEAPVPIERRA
jgi:CYTH domain-containing protein